MGGAAPGGRMLVAGQDRGTRERLRQILEADGHAVIEVANGVAGVALAMREMPDAVFVELELPALDGREMARRLRTNQDTQNVVLVALVRPGSTGQTPPAPDGEFDALVADPASDEADRLVREVAARAWARRHAA